jgi:hypothetical protein
VVREPLAVLDRLEIELELARATVENRERALDRVFKEATRCGVTKIVLDALWSKRDGIKRGLFSNGSVKTACMAHGVVPDEACLTSAQRELLQILGAGVPVTHAPGRIGVTPGTFRNRLSDALGVLAAVLGVDGMPERHDDRVGQAGRLLARYEAEIASTVTSRRQ